MQQPRHYEPERRAWQRRYMWRRSQALRILDQLRAEALRERTAA